MTEKVTGIRWENGRPFNIKTETEEGYDRGYDVDYSKKKDQYFFHNSGHGGAEHENFRNRNGNLETLNDFIDTFDAIRGRVSYCKKCGSNIPRDNLCEHLQWDDKSGIVVDQDGEEA